MPELIDTRINFHSAKEMLNGRIIRAFDGMDNPDENTAGRLSEDLAFCCRWRMCGGDVWAAIGHTIEHVGLYSYKANYIEYLQQKEAAGEIPAEALPANVPPQLKIAAE